MKQFCAACCRKPCECADANGLRKPSEDVCEHEFDPEVDEDTQELVCPNCGHREPLPVDWPYR